MDTLSLGDLYHPKKDIEQAIRHLSLELIGKVKVGNRHLKHTLKSLEIDMITLERTWKEKKDPNGREKPQLFKVRRCSITLRSDQ